ncbi:MAG TPA: hypothetical protein VGM05_16080 [Planctomycetaceae bacterium]|jgi:hypothetical protein
MSLEGSTAIQLVAGSQESATANAAEPSSTADEAPGSATADAALLELVQGLSSNHPDALWDALPPSYQADLNSLAGRFAGRLHPEAWRWFSLIAKKGEKLVSQYDAADELREPAERLLEWAASGGIGDLDQLKRPDLGRFLQTRGRLVMGDARLLVTQVLSDPETISVLRDIAGPLLDVFQDPSLLQATVKSVDGERCVLEIQLPAPQAILADLYKVELEFVRVEGKWVPQWLAENWSELMVVAGGMIDQALPAELAQDNFGVIFRYLAQLDAMIEFELAAVRGDEAVEPTLFDVVDYLLGWAEDLGLPVPAEFWGGEADAPAEPRDDSVMPVLDGESSDE